MTIHIPTWLIQIAGWAIGLVAGFLIVCGILFLIQMRAFSRSMGNWFGW